jgi:hypothetical protein
MPALTLWYFLIFKGFNLIGFLIRILSMAGPLTKEDLNLFIRHNDLGAKGGENSVLYQTLCKNCGESYKTQNQPGKDAVPPKSPGNFGWVQPLVLYALLAKERETGKKSRIVLVDCRGGKSPFTPSVPLLSPLASLNLPSIFSLPLHTDITIKQPPLLNKTTTVQIRNMQEATSAVPSPSTPNNSPPTGTNKSKWKTPKKP